MVSNIKMDSKKYYWLAGIGVLITPLIAIILKELTGSELFFWLGPAMHFVLAPSLEFVMGHDYSNPSEEDFNKMSLDPYYMRLLFFSSACFLSSFTIVVYYVINHDLGLMSYLALSLSTGESMGMAINLSHELGHKYQAAAKWTAKLNLAPVFYGHFYVEHNRGHHVRVATYEDPATSRLGENVWRFIPRSVIGGIISALKIEANRLKKKNKLVFSHHNEVLHSWLLSISLWGAVLFLGGWKMLPFLLIQSFYGIAMLEVVNYVEHYGLERKKLENGRYESCGIHHSWNSNSLMSNIFLYQLQRHADHHAHPLRPYQSLRHFDDSPQLPWGYAIMVLIALYPPAWFHIMDSKVREYHNIINKRNSDLIEKVS